jgi:GNAT superfamily N-acetyltransferase
MNAETSATRIVDVCVLPADARGALLKRFDVELFQPTFPDADIREDPQVWLDLMASDPGVPYPIVTPLIALGPDDAILGAVIIEYYRTAKAAFLTYLLVSPKARKSGLGTMLAIAALDAVTRLNGGETPVVFAEAERVEDGDTAEERLHNRARLEVLSRMGAVRADFDYVQPPLAPGRGPRALNLLAVKQTLKDGATAPAALVAAFLAELYRALGHDPDVHPNYRAMAAQLAKEPVVRFLSLGADAPAAPPAGADETAVTHVYRESPSLKDVSSFSIAYIFELQIERPRRAGPMRAFRLDAIHHALDPDDEGGRGKRSAEQQAKARAVFEALLEPLESYHDDVTAGPPGRGGRPLVFGAEGPEDVSPGRAVTLVRPARWRYAAEGRRVEMIAEESRRTLALEFRDTFCAFESGRLFYMISFEPAAGTSIDEYGIIQLQKLGHPTWSTESLRELMRFRWHGEDHGLMALITARLAQLDADKDPEPNGLRDVVKAQILEDDETLAPLDWRRLRGMVVGVEDGETFQAVLDTADTSDVIATCGGTVLVAEPQDKSAPPPPHVDPKMPEAGRRALALAGILQSVPDFPFQGGAEIWDSTRRIHGDGESFAVFSHPSFVVQVSTDWRSMRDARGCLAHCPYLLLTWMVAAHDEIIVTEMEDQFSELLYGWGETDARRAEPLADLSKTLRTISRQLISGPSKALRRSLRLRLELFRRLTVNRSRTIFRYEAEITTLAAMSEARGTDARFERVLDLLDRYENMVEDIQGLGQMESDRRLNVILGIVALMGTISVAADLNQAGWWPFRDGDPTAILFKTAGVVLAAVIVLLLLTRLRK